jgi:hypothetical protein
VPYGTFFYKKEYNINIVKISTNKISKNIKDAHNKKKETKTCRGYETLAKTL